MIDFSVLLKVKSFSISLNDRVGIVTEKLSSLGDKFSLSSIFSSLPISTTANLWPSVEADSKYFCLNVKLTPVSSCFESSLLLAKSVNFNACKKELGSIFKDVPLSTNGKFG